MYLSLCLLLASLSVAASSSSLVWHNITQAIERGALCNDFSPAGYFIRKNNPTSSNLTDVEDAFSRWVIFLESGGGCTTPKSCNERFIQQSIRKQYTQTVNGSKFINVTQAWNDYSSEPLTVTSKLMTSIWRFSEQYRAESSKLWQVEGRDILSTDQHENPEFHQYNHVLIPYCSSDLWLKKTRNYVKAQDHNFQFTFDPILNAEHQFTFRGAIIVRSVIRDLFIYHGLTKAQQVLFAGSSAGGVGVMNHAKWVQRKLRQSANPNCQLLILMDSSWFIDYRGSIYDQFAPDEIKELVKKGEIIETCLEDDPISCISAHTLLSDSRLYPQDIPTMVIFSRFDLYLLTTFLDQLPSTDIIGIMRTVQEYAGSMNTSLHTIMSFDNRASGNLSYYVTSCFQHVYFATSTLWGEDRLFGNEDIGVTFENNRFRHTVSSDYWKSYHLRHLNNTTLQTDHITIRMAIRAWMEATQLGGCVKFQDRCDGPHCNSQCPETVVLGELSPYWNIHLQFIILGAILFVSLLCLMLKAGLSVYIKMVERQQNWFLKWNYWNKYEDSESVLPFCQDEDAISVACLNLRYSVTVSKSALKRAKTPIQRKRLLSVAAAIGDEESEGVRVAGRGKTIGWRDEEGDEDKIDHDEEERGVEIQRLDSETGQTILSKEPDFAATIHQFQELHAKKQKQKRGGHGGVTKWKQRMRRRHQPTLHQKDKGHKKEIIKGVSTYFNPGELVAIMGPSGSGKTTFLDLLAGRRRGDSYQGEILVNGIPVDKVHDWYVANTGYVLQLAAPYYEELTVRENLTLAAQMRLSTTLSLSEKLDHVEKVMRETGLTAMASTPVGSNTGTGLSGGQKRRLCVALQLLSMPSLIFLDEPTSGLDASASLELLTHLHRVASSNRAVILTIHQPRLEIFHMFDKIMLLCQGQVAYHGIPDKAYEVFLDAHKHNCLTRRSNALDSKNPADVIMDMLGSEEERMAILNYYQESDEPQAVENAIGEVCNSVDEEHLQQRRRSGNTAGSMNRLGALEARATKRANLGQTLYLPVIFIGYGLLLGTVYLQTHDATSVLTGFGVFSCASALFMFPIIYSYLQKAIEIFTLEYADGVGHPGELVLQTFIRFSALALLPITASSAVIYLLAIPYDQYSFWVFLQTTVFNISLNQTWVAMLVFVIAARPDYAHRISPVLSAVAGFVGGFFVPPKLMPDWYGWLFYINPNFYGFTAVSRVLLENYEVYCPYESDIECYPSSALYILSYFSLDSVNPYLNVVVLLAMTLLYLLLAWTALTLRQSHIIPRLKKTIMIKWTQTSKDQSHSGKVRSSNKSTLVEGSSHCNLQTSPISSSNVNPTHTQVAINNDQLCIDESEEDINYGAQDGLKNESGSLLFKKVNVQNTSKGEGESNEISPTSPHTNSQGLRGDSLLSMNSSGTATGEKRKVSFNDVQVEEEGGGGSGEGAGSVGGAGLRRLLYRHRQTISKMLHDGENHEVWRPGMRRTRKADSQGSLDERRKSIFHRINTYRGGVGGDSGSATGAVPDASKSKSKTPAAARAAKGGIKNGNKAFTPNAMPPTSGNCPTVDNIKRRMEQWRRIEEEAMRQQEEQEQQEEEQERQQKEQEQQAKLEQQQEERERQQDEQERQEQQEWQQDEQKWQQKEQERQREQGTIEEQDVESSEVVSKSSSERPNLKNQASNKAIPFSPPLTISVHERQLPKRMREIICLSEPSSPADFSPRRPNIKPFRSLQDIPHLQGRNKVISALKSSGNSISMEDECFSILKLPVKVSKASSNSSVRTNTSTLNRTFSYTTMPPVTHPLALKHSCEDIGTKAVKRSDSQSTPTKTGSPKHQLTPIPLSSAVHEKRFIFPDVSCDSDSNLSQPEISMHNMAQDINDGNNSETMPFRYSACIAPASRKRKMSSVSLEMDPILEEEGDEAELSPSSCMVDDVKSHSSAPNSNYNNNNVILDAAAVSRSHGQLPVVRVELTTADLDCCSPTLNSKTETLLNSSVVATGTTTMQSQTMQSPHKPNMVAKQHGSIHCCSQQGCSDDSSIKNTLCEQQILPPVIAKRLQHDSTYSCSDREDCKREDSLHELLSSPMLTKPHDSVNLCSSQKHGEYSSIKENLHELPSPQDSPQIHREGCKNKESKSEQTSSPKHRNGSTLHCSPLTHRKDSSTSNTLHEQPHPPPSEVVTTSYDCCAANSARSQKGMCYAEDINNTLPMGFSHSITHVEFSTNKTSVHSRSLRNDTARMCCELRSKATTDNAGGTSMVHSKEIITCEQLPPVVASRPKEARCVVTGGLVGLETEYDNGKESNSTPPWQGKEPEDDLCHGPCNQASSEMQHKSKLDHPPGLLKFDQQNRGTLQTSLHNEPIERHACNNNSKSGVQRWRQAVAVQQFNSPIAASFKPLMVSVSQYRHQPGNYTDSSNAPIDSEKSSTHKQSKQEGQGPELTLTRRPNSVVRAGQPHYTKRDKPRDIPLSLNDCPSSHAQTKESNKNVNEHSGRSKLRQRNTCTSECRIPRCIRTSVQIGLLEATTRDDCNYYDNKRGKSTAIDGHVGKKILPVGSVNRGRNNHSPLTKQELRSQLTTSIPNTGVTGRENTLLSPKQAPKTHVGLIQGQNERGTEGKGEVGENASNKPVNEATSRTLVPASNTTRFNTALKTKGDNHDQASTNENPTLIRLPSASDACTALSCSHEPMSVSTINQVRDHGSRGIRGLLASSSTGRKEQQTKCCDKISADFEMLSHDLNTAGIQHHGNAGSGTVHNDEGGVPSNYHVKGCVLPPSKLRPKMVAVLHKTTSKLTPQNTSQRQAQFSSNVGGVCEKRLPEITRKLDSKPNFKANNCPMVIDKTGTKLSECSRSTRNKGTNNSNEQENLRELETVPTYHTHPINCNIPEATSRNPHAVEYPSLSCNDDDGLEPAQHKFSGMRTHTFSHPPDSLPNAASQESEQNNLRKAISTDNSPPTKTGEINRNSVSGSFHALNCPTGQPSVRCVAVDYANMTTCSGEPLPVIANSKLKSLKPSHANKQRAKPDRSSPIKYMQTDI